MCHALNAVGVLTYNSKTGSVLHTFDVMLMSAKQNLVHPHHVLALVVFQADWCLRCCEVSHNREMNFCFRS
jgi:hypothetical protein